MIAVDTSALMAILLGEPEAEDCMSALGAEADVILSAGTAAEAMIVAGRRGVAAEMARLVWTLGFQIASVTPASARRVAEAYGRWGKGIHPAALNFGDCFAYQLAQEHSCPLLFIGQDFAQTDVKRVL